MNIIKTAIAFAFIMLFPISALAAPPCLPGLPCEGVFLTPTDPISPAPGPNTPGPNISSQNLPKLSSYPAPDGNNTCDADFMNQIYAKAFLEAEREVVVNSMYIRKPDSVLEYSCFDQHLANGYDNIAGIFTESTRYQNATVFINGWWGETASIPTFNGPNTWLYVSMGTDFHDNSIESAVLSALNGYILGGSRNDDGNFEHAFLGGATTVPNTLSYNAGGAQSTCTNMYDIYYLAKCEDFDPNLSFFTLSDLATLPDPRLLPTQCQPPAGSGNPHNHGITQALITLSQNQGFTHVNYDVPQTRLDLVTMYDTGQCAPPIPTGVMVINEEYSTDLFGNPTLVRNDQYADMVCPNPSCSLQYNTGTCTQ